MGKDSNQFFNEMVENYCLENGIDPMTLFENGRKNQRVKNFRFGELDGTKYPRSQEPLHYMKVYSYSELKSFVPKPFVKKCEKKRIQFLDRKMKEIFENTPIIRRVSCLIGLFLFFSVSNSCQISSKLWPVPKTTQILNSKRKALVKRYWPKLLI